MHGTVEKRQESCAEKLSKDLKKKQQKEPKETERAKRETGLEYLTLAQSEAVLFQESNMSKRGEIKMFCVSTCIGGSKIVIILEPSSLHSGIIILEDKGHIF